MKGIKVGEKVMAKWPGSALWFPADVISVDKGSYEVKFEDGTEDDLDEKHVTREQQFRRSRSRSPARRRSRSPARKVSPSRKKAASPGRKASPSRKAAASPSRKSSRSPSRKAVAQEKATPTRAVTQSTTRRVTRTESHHSTRSATRSGAQTLESPVSFSTGRAPKTTKYEMGGPIGVFLAILLMPIFSFYSYFTCTKKKCELQYPTIISTDWRDYYNCTAYEVALGWLVVQAILTGLPVGRQVRGMALRTGARLTYRLNGFLNAVVCIVLFVTMIYYKCGVSIILTQFLPLSTALMIAALLLSVALYIMARRAPGHALNPKGNSGNIVYDFYVGHELNPRPCEAFDIKLYLFNCVIVGWALVDIALLAKAWPSFPDNPPYPLVCLVFFQLVYILDSLFFQETFLTGLDFKDGVGFYLAFGSLGMFPFIALQSRYLAMYPPATMPQWCLVPAILLNVAGYILYRQSNSMKSRFRRFPNAKDMADLESIPTSSSRRLLVAGWWGRVRKPNYLGDLMIALSWALYCGCDSIFPYFYPIMLVVLLVLRERQDSQACRDKYGAAWDRYCKRVPYRFIPYIY